VPAARLPGHIVEVGVPHSDLVLDGPVIQAAADIALRTECQ
jgi:tryptophan synthase alpha subunit